MCNNTLTHRERESDVGFDSYHWGISSGCIREHRNGGVTRGDGSGAEEVGRPGVVGGGVNRWPEPARQPCRAPALQMRAWKEPAFGTPRVVHGGLQGWLRRWGRAGCRQGRAAQGGGDRPGAAW